eukprot:gene12156-14224_t
MSRSIGSIYNDEFERERAQIQVVKASKHVQKALDIIDGRSKKASAEWLQANEEYCTKLIQKHDYNVNEAKTTIFSNWSREIEECYSATSPETHDVVSHLRMAHQVLYHDEDHHDSTHAASLVKSADNIGVTGHGLSASSDSFSHHESPHHHNKKKKDVPKIEMVKKFVIKNFAIIDIVKSYKLEYLQNDISVGLSSGTMIIPQSMAYAFLAGLPPIYGLYTAFIPSLIYTLFGSSRHLAPGPLALMSIMVGGAVQGVIENPNDMVEYVGLANLLSLLVGINFMIMCFLQLGFLINFLSRPVLSGFTSAAAIIIILSQANFLFGISGGNQKFAWKYAIDIARHIPETNWIAVLMSVICFALLYFFKHHFKVIPKTTIPVPAPLILVTLGLLASYFLDLEGKGLSVVNKIPSGLPRPTFFHNFSFDDAMSLYKDSLVIPIVALIETVSAAKVAATKSRYELSMNRELFALGAANIIGCIFQSYPAAGAFGRTSLHLSSGAKTQLTTIISVIVVGVTLLFLTQMFYYLPKVVLASIVIFAVAQLVDLEEVQKLWRINKVDMFLLLVAFWATLVLGVQPGIATAVLLSLILVIYQSSRPNTYVCGRIPGTATYNDVELYPEAITENGVIVFRFDSPIIFVNAYYLRKQLKKIYKLEDETKNPTVKAIVLDCSSVTAIDSTGIKYLKELIRELTECGIPLCFADIRANVIESLKSAGVFRDIGADHFFMRVHEAVRSCPNLSIRPLVEEKPGLKFNCFGNQGNAYNELY